MKKIKQKGLRNYLVWENLEAYIYNEVRISSEK